MKIKDIMSASPCFILGTATIQEAAQKMKQLDCGFLPVGENDKLIGVITDRDIATRAVAENLSANTPVAQVMTKNVLYCTQDDTADAIAQNMTDNQVRRLVVLSDRTSKRLVGVVALCDIVNAAKSTTASELIKGVSQPSNTNKKNTKAA